MRRPHLLGGVLAAVTAAALAVACSEPVSKVGPTPQLPQVVSVELEGPASMAPGQSAQYTAVVRMTDGTVKRANAASRVGWRSSNTAVLRVDVNGLATAGQNGGEAILTVSVSPSAGTPSVTRQASREVVVLPDGTYRLTGVVNDAEFPSIHIVGATVETVPAGALATTDAQGVFKLYGVSTNALVRVTKSGYLPAERQLQLNGHTSANFDLTPAGPRPEFTGAYTLAIDATEGCPATFPDALRRRQYDVVIVQTGINLDVTLTEPRFRLNSAGRGNRFTGRSDPDGAVFTLQQFFSYYYPYYGLLTYPSVAEVLPDGSHLVPYGTATTTGSASKLTGRLSGGLEHHNVNFPSSRSFIESCRSLDLEFSLTRK